MLVVWLLTGAAHTLLVQGLNQCHPGWFLYGGMCYGFAPDPLSWAEAQTMCQSYGATLAEPRDSDTNEWLKSELTGMHFHGTWLGANDAFHEGTWEWVSDRIVLGPFMDWSSGKPNDVHGEDCMEMNEQYQYRWNDRHCHEKISYVCQIPPDSDTIIG